MPGLPPAILFNCYLLIVEDKIYFDHTVKKKKKKKKLKTIINKMKEMYR